MSGWLTFAGTVIGVWIVHSVIRFFFSASGRFWRLVGNNPDLAIKLFLAEPGCAVDFKPVGLSAYSGPFVLWDGQGVGHRMYILSDSMEEIQMRVSRAMRGALATGKGSSNIMGRIATFFRSSRELGRFKRQINDTSSTPILRDQSEIEMPSQMADPQNGALDELATLSATRKPIAAVLEHHGHTGTAGKAKLIELFQDLLKGGAGQWVGRTYVPAAALCDPNLLELLLGAEAKARAGGASGRAVATDIAFKALSYCEQQERHC